MLNVLAEFLNKIIKRYKKDIRMEVRNAAAPMLEKSSEIKQIANKQNPSPEQPIPHKFEIEIYQADYEGSDQNGNPVPKWKKVKYDNDVIIQCATKKELDELQQQYAMCDQRFKIIRDLGPIYELPSAQKPVEPSKQSSTAEQNTSEDRNAHTIQADNHLEERNANAERTITSNVCAAHDNQHKKISKPKIVTIGDIQLKYDGDKVYQKQWIKLSSAESLQLRVVNDANNKLVNMQGKHFEMKKWVLVEQSSGDDSNELDFN